MDLRNLIQDLRLRLVMAGVGVSRNDVGFYWKESEAVLSVRCQPGFARAVSRELQQAKVPITCEIKEMAP